MESLANKTKNAPISITAPQKRPLEKYMFEGMLWSRRAVEGVSLYSMETPQYHVLPERGGPVNVEKDITKSTKPRREPMRSGGETWAVQAGKQPMTPPRIDSASL